MLFPFSPSQATALKTVCKLQVSLSVDQGRGVPFIHRGCQPVLALPYFCLSVLHPSVSASLAHCFSVCVSVHPSLSLNSILCPKFPLSCSVAQVCRPAAPLLALDPSRASELTNTLLHPPPPSTCPPRARKCPLGLNQGEEVSAQPGFLGKQNPEKNEGENVSNRERQRRQDGGSYL